MNYKTYIKSSEWKEKRKTKLEACQNKCECEGGCIRSATQVHHRHYETLGNESMEDLQALCAKCHMSKSPKVRNFYGNPVRNCCLVEGQRDIKRPLPYHVWNEANFFYVVDGTGKYDAIAEELQTDPVIVALLDNLGIMFACGDIEVTDEVTKAIDKYADVVPAKEVDLDGYCDIAYKIKSDFEKYFDKNEKE